MMELKRKEELQVVYNNLNTMDLHMFLEGPY